MITLTNTLISLGVARTQADISALAGRRPSWLSALLAHGRRPGTAALAVLLHNLTGIYEATIMAAGQAETVDDQQAYLAGAEELQGVIQTLQNELTRRIKHAET